MKSIRAVDHLLKFALSSLRKRERELGTVIEVLRPGPLGIVEHKFSASELANARLVAARALEKWREEAAKRS
ncbi:unnamed protein product [Calypogeia fissa]